MTLLDKSKKVEHTKTRIAFVVRTVGLEYDDRIRKECLTLLKNDVDVFIYVNFSDNRKEEGMTSYGVPYRSFKLFSRDKLPQAKFLLVKALEFYFKVNTFLNEYDLIWAHEEYTFVFPLLSKKNRCIWDLHEIPFRFEKTFMKPIFHYIERRSKKIIHANKHRIDYLESNDIVKCRSKNVFINNFPDRKFLNSTEEDKEYKKFEIWLGSSTYAYLQGLSVARRYPLNTIECIMQTPELKAVVIGEFDSNAYSSLMKKYGIQLHEKIYFCGMVNQLAITNYLKSALFSIVLYETSTPNNTYCEANRLYQSIILNIPVIVGCNPPMKEIISKYNFGLVLKGDGKNISELSKATKSLIINHEKYLTSLKKNSFRVVWNDKCIDPSWYL